MRTRRLFTAEIMPNGRRTLLGPPIEYGRAKSRLGDASCRDPAARPLQVPRRRGAKTCAKFVVFGPKSPIEGGLSRRSFVAKADGPKGRGVLSGRMRKYTPPLLRSIRLRLMASAGQAPLKDTGDRSQRGILSARFSGLLFAPGFSRGGAIG